MSKIVQCVPNFSEGCRTDVIESIVSSIREVPGVRLIDYSSDVSHNRSVVSFIGEPEAVFEGAFRGTACAAELIDMTLHRGNHPRMGATDVIPFIPVLNLEMDECVDLAQKLGRRIADKLAIPVYLYGEAASRPDRQDLSIIRRGQYEGLIEGIKNVDRKPDFGPQEVNLHAGATAVGARMPLIAYNINLNTDNLEIAKRIARSIRGSSGGYPSIKAMGIILAETGKTQVTINVCDFRSVSLYRVFETVKREAERYGAGITGSEIVGLVPLDALVETAGFYLQLNTFNQHQVLERNLLE